VAKKIVDEMPPHKVYVEPFAGAGHVFFQKPKAEVNVLNDANHELIQFFKDIKGKKLCCNIGSDKEKFLSLRNKSNKSACEKIYVNKNSFGGYRTFTDGATYGYVKKPLGQLECIDGNKLSGVHLESKDFRETIKQHDSKDTLFYVDPPYVKANEKECLYGKGFCGVTPKDVADSVKNVKGKVIVSYDDHPDVRKAFHDFKIKKIDLQYQFARDKNLKHKGKTKELLIKNY